MGGSDKGQQDGERLEWRVMGEEGVCGQLLVRCCASTAASRANPVAKPASMHLLVAAAVAGSSRAAGSTTPGSERCQRVPMWLSAAASPPLALVHAGSHSE